MTDLVFNNFTTDRKYGGDFFERIAGVVAKELDLESKKIELSVNLVGEGRIKALNKKYQGKNRTTDVLSFPLQNRISPERGREGSQRASASNGISTKPTQDGIMGLGDIFICLPVAKKYAKRENVSVDYKLAFLTVHGFLHLLGYDHEKSAGEKEKMFELQDKILKRLALSV